MTTTSAELRPLLKLLDDESPVVREAVRNKLAAMRRELPESLLALGEPLDEDQERLIAEILNPVCREELEASWLAWRWLPTSHAQLEEAMAQLSAFLSGWQANQGELARRLDALAECAKHDGKVADVRMLAEFLFGGRGSEARLRGNGRDYYAPQNSNLLWVLANGLGNPISLTCIYMLVARRLDLKVEGCNFPMHFLARVEHEGQTWLVDCFNRGRFMLVEDVAKHHPASNPSMEEVINQSATVETIIARVLRNLDESYERSENMGRRQIVRRLMLKLMED
jgi:regulator of sirC expression with transglutaminase-like and TPR domain